MMPATCQPDSSNRPAVDLRESRTRQVPQITQDKPMRAVKVGDAAVGPVVKLVAEDGRRVKPCLA